MTRRTATNMMNVARVYAGKIPTVGNMGAKALYALAAPSTPTDIRDAVEALVADGEKFTAAERWRSCAVAGSGASSALLVKTRDEPVPVACCIAGQRRLGADPIPAMITMMISCSSGSPMIMIPNVATADGERNADQRATD